MARTALGVDKELSQPFNFAVYRFMGRLTQFRGFVNLMNFVVRSSFSGRDMEGFHCEERYIPSRNGGEDIRIRIFRPKGIDKELPGLLYNHGGAYMSLVPEMFLNIMKMYMDVRLCVVVAPDYRKSVKAPFPAGFNDCYDTLLWMKENANELNIKPSKFIVAGDSAGGGMTAALTLKARDTKDVDIAFQIPVCPMIDHRQMTDSAKNMQRAPIYNSNDNAIAWRYYLENMTGDVPAYASPALNTDYTGFPPTISIVGSVEPFRDETVNYIEDLKKYNIPVKFGLYEGGYHGFQTAVEDAAISKKASKFLLDSYKEYYDKYTQ